jgi:hypothetical protein
MDLPWDGSRFKLSIFETELRRRLWWTLRRLESRCAEENGFQPGSVEHLSEAKFPLNINDEDLRPDATEAPHPRAGCTDMTFCLINFEVVDLISRINNMRAHPVGSDGDKSDSNDVVQKKAAMIEECQTRLESRYLHHCNSSRPFDWMTITFTKLILVSYIEDKTLSVD